MPFKPGQQRPANAGRKKGTPNKDALPLKELAQKLGVDPFEVLLRFAAEDWAGLGYSQRSEVKYTNAGIEFEEFIITPAMRLKAASEACQYLHAKRKAIENSVDPELMDTIKSLEGKSDEELVAILNISQLN